MNWFISRRNSDAKPEHRRASHSKAVMRCAIRHEQAGMVFSRIPRSAVGTQLIRPELSFNNSGPFLTRSLRERVGVRGFGTLYLWAESIVPMHLRQCSSANSDPGGFHLGVFVERMQR